MSVSSTARTVWRGGLADGSGRTELVTSGTAQLDVSWKARSEGSDSVTTPEELLAAAHASCFSMALSKALGDNGTEPTELEVQAVVTFVPGTGVTESALTVTAQVPGLDDEGFGAAAADAAANCPVSKALAGVDIRLESATLR